MKTLISAFLLSPYLKTITSLMTFEIHSSQKTIKSVLKHCQFFIHKGIVIESEVLNYANMSLSHFSHI